MAEVALTPELALSHLQELSGDIRRAVLLDGCGALAAHAGGDEREGHRARELVLKLFDCADAAAPAGPVSQVEVALGASAVFAVREPEWTLAVVTAAPALSSLMFYDLRSVLSRLETRAA